MHGIFRAWHKIHLILTNWGKVRLTEGLFKEIYLAGHLNLPQLLKWTLPTRVRPPVSTAVGFLDFSFLHILSTGLLALFPTNALQPSCICFSVSASLVHAAFTSAPILPPASQPVSWFHVVPFHPCSTQQREQAFPHTHHIL